VCYGEVRVSNRVRVRSRVGISVSVRMCKVSIKNTLIVAPRAGSGVVRIDPLPFLAGCHKR